MAILWGHMVPEVMDPGVVVAVLCLAIGNPLNPAPESARWRSGQCGLVILYIERPLEQRERYRSWTFSQRPLPFPILASRRPLKAQTSPSYTNWSSVSRGLSASSLYKNREVCEEATVRLLATFITGVTDSLKLFDSASRADCEC